MNDMKLKRQIASIELPENINWKKFECRSIKPFISEINKSNNQTEDIQFIDWLIDEMKWFNGGKSNCYEKVKLCSMMAGLINQFGNSKPPIPNLVYFQLWIMVPDESLLPTISLLVT